jgi:sugar phosphate isomerase/epimerase
MNRRHFLGTAAAAAGAAILPGFGPAIIRRASRRAGVQIGAITYSYRSMPSSAEELLQYMVEAGLTTTELMGGPAEQFAGAPQVQGGGGGGRGQQQQQLTPEEQAARDAERAAQAEELRRWRLSDAPMQRYAALRKMYNDAGVTIDILKLGSAGWTDEEIDYAYNAARTLGARGISFEAGDEAAQRMGAFATKHRLYNGMHNHTQVGDADFSFDRLLSFSPYNALNLDIGHYVAGTGLSPIPVIQKYHDRITHLHLKDRQTPANGGANLPWGQGDTPIGEVLRLLEREQYPITGMIELEYQIPEGSNALEEVKKCAEFCREALS